MKDTIKREGKLHIGRLYFLYMNLTKKIIFKIHKELLQVSRKKDHLFWKKWAKGLNRHVTKEYIQMTSKYTKEINKHYYSSGETKLKLLNISIYPIEWLKLKS